MVYHYKKENLICYDKEDLKNIFEKQKRENLEREIFLSGYTNEELNHSKEKQEEIINKIMPIVKDKEDIEFFHALYVFSKFYPEKAKICFRLKENFNLKIEKIDSIDKLKLALKEYDLTDFSFLFKKEDNNEECNLVNFQLKCYRGEGSLEKFTSFIKSKLLHYGNNIGNVNLLFTMGSENFIIKDNFFHKIYDDLKEIDIKGEGQIIISYNESNKFIVVNSVYPQLSTKRLPCPNLDNI